MSDSDDTPPPIPSSPPPPSKMEDTGVMRRGRRTSEKFKALQKMLSESKGMYTSPSGSSSPPAPPPNKKPHLDGEEDVHEPPKLSHATKSRPKRNVRPPSRNSLGGKTDKRGSTQEIASASLEVRTEREETSDDEAPVPPPPLPSSAPPEVPSGLDLPVSGNVGNKHTLGEYAT